MSKIVGVIADNALQVQSDGVFSYKKIKLTSFETIIDLPCYVALENFKSIELLESLGFYYFQTGFNIKPPPLQESEAYLGINTSQLRKYFNRLKTEKWEAEFPILQRLEKEIKAFREIKYFCSGVSLTEDVQLRCVFETKLVLCPSSLKGIPCWVQNFFDEGPFVEFCKKLGATEFVNKGIDLKVGETVLAFPVLGIIQEEKWGIKTLIDKLPNYQHALQITLL